MIFRAPELDDASRKVLSQIHALRSQLGTMLREPRRWDGLLRRNALAKALRGSNTIEGYNVTEDDAVAAVAGEPPLEADEKTWAEIMGYREAMTFVLQLTRDAHFRFSSDFIRSLHYMMLKHDLSKGPGLWRPGYIAVKDSESGDIVYEGPDFELVPGLMDELIADLNGDSDVDPIIRAALAHLNLVMIHPFRDGNGRMGRCLQTMVLARGGHLSPVFSSIEEYLGRNTRAYYDVLEATGQGAWHPERDTTDWVRFCLTAHFRQATTVLTRHERMKRVWDLVEEEVRTRGLPERTIFAIVDAMTGYRVRNNTYREIAGISVELASRDLRQVVKSGLLVPHGEKRGRYYLASAHLLDLRKRVDRPKSPIPDPFTQLSLEL